MESQDEFWQEVYARYRSPLIEYVNSRLFPILRRNESPGYAEDVVSETFSAAYQKLKTFDSNRGEFDSWLFAIARNKTYDFLRRHSELVSERSLDQWPVGPQASVTEPDFLYEKGAQKNPKTVALRQALKQLTPYDQELLICRLGNKLSYEEIERYFNFSVKRETLRVHVNRAEARLRKLLVKMPEFGDLPEVAYGNR